MSDSDTLDIEIEGNDTGDGGRGGNDLFADRIILGSAIFVVTSGTNVGFTGEADEPAQSGDITSAWWRWTAPATGTVTIDTFGSNFDTYLTLATGNSVNALNVVAQNDDAPFSSESRIVQIVSAGTTYNIAVDGFRSRVGEIDLNISFNA